MQDPPCEGARLLKTHAADGGVAQSGDGTDPLGVSRVGSHGYRAGGADDGWVRGAVHARADLRRGPAQTAAAAPSRWRAADRTAPCAAPRTAEEEPERAQWAGDRRAGNTDSRPGTWPPTAAENAACLWPGAKPTSSNAAERRRALEVQDGSAGGERRCSVRAPGGRCPRLRLPLGSIGQQCRDRWN